MMLVLSRKKNETFVADLRQWGLGLLSVVVVEIRGDKVRLGVDCEKVVPVHRQEVFEAIERVGIPRVAQPKDGELAADDAGGSVAITRTKK